MGMLPDEQWARLRRHPDWDEQLHKAIEAFPEARWLQLTTGITAGILEAWQTQGLLDRPGWWEDARLRIARAGGWDLARDQISRTWLKEQMFRWMTENLDLGEASARSADELGRLIELQSEIPSAEGISVPEPPIVLTPSELEDLLDLAAARQRLADADEDDWVSWDEVEAGLKA